ncbi:MAG: DUF58 domain-containing protein [candidate division WOR-3 bacterium]|nr:DUF58 domain-containing protein [candidate division WOR-3 bacterium]MCX7757908.1 DUF58 domain-containing protein [candidate division WOR-3 bacterium]MDW7987863.1 DUF58 domain-containing protein [candidate division WOR-3 bacterium]
MENYRRFLKPEVIVKLKTIELKARLVVEGFLAGLHRSPYKGFAQEFAEYRAYQPGDELKRIDWKIYAKTDRFYVKEFQEETNLKAYILIDASGSMSYKSNGISKLEYAKFLSASLAYLLIKQRDSVGLVVFTSKINKYLPPRSKSDHLNVILHVIDKITPGGDTNLANTFHELAEKIKRRGLVIILSDLLDNKDAVLSALKHFRHKKHEVLVFHILDPNELKLAYNEPLILKDLETGSTIRIDPRIIRKDYEKAVNRYFTEFKRECHENLVDYLQITTDLPLDHCLLEYLQKRSRLG